MTGCLEKDLKDPSLITGQLEKRDLPTELDKVKRKIEDARFQVAKFVEQHYQDFDPLLVHSRELSDTSSKLSEEVQQLVDKAEIEVISIDIVLFVSPITTLY